MDLCNWTYSYQNGHYVIQPNREIEKPSAFVKYYSIKKYNVDAVIANKLYFSHPLNLNDPFDSCIQLIDLRNLLKDELLQLYFENREHLLLNGKIPSNDQIQKTINKEYDRDRMDLLKDSLTLYWNFIFKDYGVLSLGSSDNSLLMWSYYTNHEGFAIRFEDINFANEVVGPFPINYSKKYDVVYPESRKIPQEYLLYLTNIKSDAWCSEGEWRFILNRPNMSIPDYKNDELDDLKRLATCKSQNRKIILGYKFFKGFNPKPIDTNSYIYSTEEESENLIQKRRLIDWLIDEKLEPEQINTTDDNSFKLLTKRIAIERVGNESYKVTTLN